MAEGVTLAPFRTLDDFVLQAARFQIPPFNEPKRITNRILNNLLYYQTNYFILTMVIFLLVGIMNPVEMICGGLMVGLLFVGATVGTNNMPLVKQFQARYPLVSILVLLMIIYFIMSSFNAVLTFLFGIALPLLLTLVHACLRMRNIQNKIVNKVEYIGVKRTPMGIILECLSQDQEAGS